MERGDRESDEDMARLVADLQKRMERTEVRRSSQLHPVHRSIHASFKVQIKTAD